MSWQLKMLENPVFAIRLWIEDGSSGPYACPIASSLGLKNSHILCLYWSSRSKLKRICSSEVKISFSRGYKHDFPFVELSTWPPLTPLSTVRRSRCVEDVWGGREGGL